VTRGPPGHEETPRVAARRLNINTATVQELEALPGIGPVLAGRIIAGRPYRAVEDLDRVPGIGPKRLGKIRPLVTAE
jgi:competence protein ComEA